MPCRLALLTLLGALCACDVPTRGTESAPPKAQENAVAAPLSKQQIDDLSERCAIISRDQFRRAWKDESVNAAEEKMKAEFTNYYNAKLNTCFYLLRVTSGGTLKKMLFDINGGELYGEYLGPAIVESPSAGRSNTCRVESLYCASEGEWEVLVRPYMED